MQTMPAVLCIFIVAYIIYLEIKNPKKDRDLFVDISISVIIMLVGIYSMYEYKFDIKLLVVDLYLGLLALSFGYIGLVIYNYKRLNKDNNIDIEETVGDENVDKL